MEKVITDPASAVIPDTQDIRLDGERLRMPRKRYFLLNKPKGVLCTNHDPQGRPRAMIWFLPTVTNCLPLVVLDESTEGLLLITNDGDWRSGWLTHVSKCASLSSPCCRYSSGCHSAAAAGWYVLLGRLLSISRSANPETQRP